MDSSSELSQRLVAQPFLLHGHWSFVKLIDNFHFGKNFPQLVNSAQHLSAQIKIVQKLLLCYRHDWLRRHDEDLGPHSGKFIQCL